MRVDAEKSLATLAARHRDWSHQTRTNNDFGCNIFANVSPGKYSVIFVKSGFSTQKLESHSFDYKFPYNTSTTYQVPFPRDRKAWSATRWVVAAVTATFVDSLLGMDAAMLKRSASGKKVAWAPLRRPGH